MDVKKHLSLLEFNNTLDLTGHMLDWLDVYRSIVGLGVQVMPGWRVEALEGTYCFGTQFDHDNLEQRDRMLTLVARFMGRNIALNYVVAAKTRLGPERGASGEEALLVVGVRKTDKFALIQRVIDWDLPSFAPVQCVLPQQVERTYFQLFPRCYPFAETFTQAEVDELESVFGPGGEWEASKLPPYHGPGSAPGSTPAS
jgi:hypothetical protein